MKMEDTETMASSADPAAEIGGQTGLPAVNVQQAAGTSAQAIQSAVDAYRQDLGDSRQEINWDGVPDNRAAPNLLPADFFNTVAPRGVVFSTHGTGFQVSANAGVAPIEFDNINPTYSRLFTTFSRQRLFTPLGSNIMEVDFFVPGSSTPATTNGSAPCSPMWTGPGPGSSTSTSTAAGWRGSTCRQAPAGRPCPSSASASSTGEWHGCGSRAATRRSARTRARTAISW